MKTFPVRDQVPVTGEYILGVADTQTHACYMIYGKLQPGESQRLLKAGAGHEELVLSLNADLVLTGYFDGVLPAGQAILIQGEQTSFVSNPSDQVAEYVVAGGHTPGRDHHHSHHHHD
ncbi:MAG: hypothetical protein H6741_31405 [Alphaproteobacteria bacterium]|nr:hypothetical protein [Alphaproteobacteria bacterium]